MFVGVDLFAGAGGMSLGAANAGIEVSVAVEVGAAACRTYSRNHPATKVVNADIRTLPGIDIDRRDRELVVFGGPPCQGFSTSNQRTRNDANPRNWLFLEFLRIVEYLSPEWVVFENVAGILQTSGGTFIDAFRARLICLGYRLSEGLLDSVSFGVPQRRSRYFVVGCRDRDPPGLEAEQPASPAVTFADATADLPALANGAETDELEYCSPPRSEYAEKLRRGLSRCTGHLVTRNGDAIIERYPFIPQGGNWRDIPQVLMGSYSNRFRCHTGIYRRLAENEPSIVIGNFRKNMLIHPTQDRGLSVREAARLQSFPDTYVFVGTIGIQQQQVGNAVPPLLAQAVFASIRSACGDGCNS